jgi:DNA-binding FadR family transcriptional regulator
MFHYINDIEDLIVFARRMDVYNIRHEYNEENSITQHQDILSAIMERDGDRAFSAMEKNTKEVLKRMVYK